MAALKRSERGFVRVSNTVIAKLAGYAATSCYGVVGMASKSSTDGVARLLKMENINKGIKVKIEDNKINISVYIIVGYGINIRTIGETIQTNVKYQVEKALGMQVGSVKVVIEGIRE
ncbi:MAG: Asp23/Gls24 family envelope stress response protein [Ruminococcaceae bacterium]|nr:Asp23/Gls24 family envelope stress response protein [Oscillospiraceae bacterium]